LVDGKGTFNVKFLAGNWTRWLKTPRPQLASPPAPLQGERGVMCFVRPHPLTATGLTPNPSPRGEGSDVLCKFMLTWQLVKGGRCKGV